jgi:hypothetical protein
MPTLAGQMQTAAAQTAAVLTGGATAAGAPQTALLANLTANNAAGFNIDINGLVTEVGPINFTGAASLTVCAARINTAIQATCTCTWVTDHFLVVTHVTGPTATLTYATPPSGPTVEADVSSILLLTAGTAASLTQGATGGALNPQWVPCDGRYIRVRTPFGAPRPHANMLYSTGTPWDYWRNVGRWAGAHGVVPKPDTLRIPRDPSGTWYVSTADDSSETSLVTPPTVQKPPAGVR